MELIRRFLPVGQGAFYSEEFLLGNGESFAVVYDCGSLNCGKNNTKLKKIIDEHSMILARKEKEEEGRVDVLFVSHFDKDHINGIPYLIEKHKDSLRVIFVPELTDELKNIACIFLYAFGYTAEAQFVLNPEKFLNSREIINTKIVYVRQERRGNEEGGIFPIEGWIDPEGKNPPTIDSGSSVRKDKFWEYIPNNSPFSSGKANVLKKLSNEITAILGNNWSTLSPEKVDFISQNKKNNLKKIYNKFYSDLNDSSLFVYSGPLVEEVSSTRSIIFPYRCYCSCFYDFYGLRCADELKLGAIYTGDGQLSNIATFYEKRADKVGLIQIPHHGSKGSYCKSSPWGVFNGSRYICPMSFGMGNRYGHPSSAVYDDLLSRGHLPVFVTNDPASCFCVHYKF